MVNSNINVKISATDNASAQVTAVNNSVSSLRTNIIAWSQGLQAANLSWDMLGKRLLEFATAGISANAQLETLQTKLTGLISANAANVTSTSEVISAQEKWAMSADIATQALEKLKDISTATGNELSATADAFTMFYATANNQGSADEAMNAFNAIALAAQVAGKDIASLVPMFDSLATGTVVAGSEMGLFMKIVGLTNEELKAANESDTLFTTIQSRLAQFGSVAAMSANTYDMELNKLKATISSLSTEASKPIFDTLKNSIAGLNQFLNENKEALNSCVKALSEVAQYVGVAGGAFGAYRAAVALGMSATVSFNASAITLTGSLATMSAGLKAANAAFMRLLPKMHQAER